MKKEMKIGILDSWILFIALFFLVYLLVGLFVSFFNIPRLSPYFPDFAPFEASVTIIQNSAPIIIDFDNVDFDNEIFVCEGNRTNHYFNVSDADRNLALVRIVDPPPIPLFAIIDSTPIAPSIIYNTRLISGITDKSDVGSHNEIIEAIDSSQPQPLTDRESIIVTIIEKNNQPIVETIGVQTFVWIVGENSTFYKQVNASDIEDGNENSGFLGFNLSFLNYERLFNISVNGTMSFTPNATLNLSVVTLPLILDLRVCVNDTGIENPHSRIQEFCGQDGSSIESCQQFSLTITDENRAPIIIDFNPTNLTFGSVGERENYFNLTAKDPDGTIPDVYWYIEDNFVKYDNMTNFSEFRQTFGCGVSGLHKVRADVTDGLLNDSVEWEISVSEVACPVTPSSGGGGGSIEKCEEQWGCFNWNVCQDISISLEDGLLSKEDFSSINERCRLDNFAESCGFQLRDCVDTNNCRTTAERPELINHCYYVENPSCEDGVKNCHSGSCELLIDCGGPCNACPTCSDSIENQGESGVDCGGPCPLICEERENIFQRVRFTYLLILLILILIAVVIIQLIRIYRAKKRLKGYLPVRAGEGVGS